MSNVIEIKNSFKKLSYLLILAKGTRTINGFAADTQVNADYLADIIHCKISSLPQINFLNIIADHSEDRVSLNDLKIACGYSLYENGTIDDIKNIEVKRGWFAWCDFRDHAIDSEYGGYRVVLVVQNNIGNTKSSTTEVIPLTTKKTKAKMPTHVEISSRFGLPEDSTICVEGRRAISKRRLVTKGFVQKIAECPEHIMREVEIAMLKSEGTIDVYMPKEEALKRLLELQRPVTNSYRKREYGTFQLA